MSILPRVFVHAAKTSEASLNTLRVLSFNVLADGLAQSGDFTYPSPAQLEWEARFPLLLEEIRRVAADIVCLSECNRFERDWLPVMQKEGYQGLHCPKANSPAAAQGSFEPDGVAIFYKSSRFEQAGERLSGASRPVYLLLPLRDLQTSVVFDVAMLHLKAGLDSASIRATQVHDMFKAIEPARVPGRPFILCGDFNGESDEKFYSFVTEKKGLRDAYASLLPQITEVAGEKRWTTWKFRTHNEATVETKRGIDFIFTTPDVSVLSAYAPPAQVDPHALPCSEYGSDHVAVACDLTLPPPSASAAAI